MSNRLAALILLAAACTSRAASPPEVAVVGSVPAPPPQPVEPSPPPPARPEPPASVDAGRCERLTVAAGSSRSIPAGDVRSYSSGGPAFYDVHASNDGRELVIEGKRPGSSTVLLVRASGTTCLDVVVTP